MIFLAKQLTSKRTYFLKIIPEDEDSVLSTIVSVIPYLKENLKNSQTKY